ncbi:MAG: aldehyde dehydrogenase [Bacteroidales bacterium]|nr:aldehyde dehydrogenase [Bacteroidales bacterium]MBN2633661.1 aldehyde dehydrogenase [Bacteroidales bacterium]
MNLSQRIYAFSLLGDTLRRTLAGEKTHCSDRLAGLISSQQHLNPWFTPGNVIMALTAIAGELTTVNLEKWTKPYPDLRETKIPARIAVIMAGNIPLVGFHDFLSVLISGNIAVVKKSSKDPDLIMLIRDLLVEADPGISRLINITEGVLPDFDAVIATGSDNTSRYFEQYFGKYPHIIRKNRNSIAILDGTETKEDLEALGSDVFSYFGLGCRSVSKMYVPADFDLPTLAAAWNKYADIINHSKYASNYDYYKAVYLVNRDRFTDTGFVLLKEDRSLASPVAVLHYELYRPGETPLKDIQLLKDKIQCIAGRDHIPFGSSQSPALWDYADGVDTLDFLLKKISTGFL